MVSSPEASSPPLGHLGIYRIESLLGRGGMGEVYLAWDEVLERHVAIKRIRDDRIGDEAQPVRFLREARAVARLDHPAIVRIYHVLERDDSQCLVMEYVRGTDLTKLIADADGRPQARLADFGIGALTERDKLSEPGPSDHGLYRVSSSESVMVSPRCGEVG